MDVVDSSCIGPNLRPREIPVDPDVVWHVMWLVPMASTVINTTLDKLQNYYSGVVFDGLTGN
jgi:hypothetical protein